MADNAITVHSHTTCLCQILHNDFTLSVCCFMHLMFSPGLLKPMFTMKHCTILFCACVKLMKVLLVSQRDICPLRISNRLFKTCRQVYTRATVSMTVVTGGRRQPTSETVSYTHLDVYKRQLSQSSRYSLSVY